MQDNDKMHELVMNLPVPCMYFNEEDVCVIKNKPSSDFLNKWELECHNLNDMNEIFNTPFEITGNVLIKFGHIGYSYFPVNNGHMLIFNPHDGIPNIHSISSHGIIIADRNGKIVNSNKKCKNILGYVPADVKSLSSLKGRWTDSGIKLSSSDWGMLKTVRTGKSSECEYIDIVCRNGERTTISVSSSPISDSSGSLIGSVSFIEDVSKQRTAEMDAITGKREAEECLKDLVCKIKAICNDSRLDANESIVKISAVADNAYRSYQIINKYHPSEVLDVSCILESAGYECEKSAGNGTTVLCEIDGSRLVSANMNLKEAFVKLIENIVRKSSEKTDITIKMKDYHEGNKQFHYIEIKNRLDDYSPADERILVDCTNSPDLDLAFASTILRSFDGKILAEKRVDQESEYYFRFIVIIPIAINSNPLKMGLNVENFAYWQ